jgi:tRNA-dihydrouridine synthase A
MSEPRLVADCVRAMLDAVSIPVTVKHRIGIDRNEEYGFVRDFVGQLFDAGCRAFIVHARNAWLDGLSPKENRDVPPLRYQVVRDLKRDFPQATIVLNGGLMNAASVRAALESHASPLDGVMLGRAAYQQPRLLAELDKELFDGAQMYVGGSQSPETGIAQEATQALRLLEPMTQYLERAVARGATPWSVIRHTLGLMHGLPGARTWRRMLSDPAFVQAHGTQALRSAASIAFEGHASGRISNQPIAA